MVLICILFLTGSFSISADKDDVGVLPPTYSKEIKKIIDMNCTLSDCHGKGSKNGDFTKYVGMSKVIEKGKFYKKVITKRTMPKDKVLSEEDYGMLKSWAESGYLK